jgi:hypothetical protein
LSCVAHALFVFSLQVMKFLLPSVQLSIRVSMFSMIPGLGEMYVESCLIFC